MKITCFNGKTMNTIQLKHTFWGLFEIEKNIFHETIDEVELLFHFRLFDCSAEYK